MDSRRILTIVVTFNAMKWIDRCLGSLMSSHTPTEVMVVDNDSQDGTVEHVRGHFPTVMVVESKENLGFGAANNIGLRYAVENGYEYVYLLNQDAWVFPDTFGCLIDAMESDSRYGILSPVQMTASLRSEDRQFRAKCMSAGKVYEDGKIYEVSFVMAAHWMISSKCLMTVGGFSPAFPHYGEDDNYIHRARYHGFKVGFLMGARAVHDREDRPSPKEVSMKRKIIISKTKICDPSRSTFLQMLWQPFEMALMSLRHCSLTILSSIPALFRAYPALIKYRRSSKRQGAFL